jgi:hypothetical protein
MQRIQLSLESEQYEILAEIAEQEGWTISDLVRESISRYLAERAEEAQSVAALRAIEKLTQIREAIREDQGLHQCDLLAEVRAGWEQDAERVWRDES